jgi:Domain of unknown function (DUF4386)
MVTGWLAARLARRARTSPSAQAIARDVSQVSCRGFAADAAPAHGQDFRPCLRWRAAMTVAGLDHLGEMWSRSMRDSVRSGKGIARVAGVLFIAATAASLLSTSLLNPVLDGSGYLARTFAHQDRVIAGVSLELVAAFAGAAIAISLYPVLARHRPGLALGSAGFRLIEAVLYVVGAIGALLLVTLSQQAASATAPRSPYFYATGALLRALRDQASLAGVLAFYIGAFMYYWIFFQAGLVPRWLSGWGLAGVVLGFTAGILVLFRVTGYMSTLQVLFNLPIGVNEMVLAVWLIVKGFSSPATDLRPPVSGTGVTRAAPTPLR